MKKKERRDYIGRGRYRVYRRKRREVGPALSLKGKGGDGRERKCVKVVGGRRGRPERKWVSVTEVGGGREGGRDKGRKSLSVREWEEGKDER